MQVILQHIRVPPAEPTREEMVFILGQCSEQERVKPRHWLAVKRAAGSSKTGGIRILSAARGAVVAVS